MSEMLPKGWIETKLNNTVLHKKGKKPETTISSKCDGYVPYLLIAEMEGEPVRNYTNDPKVSIAKDDDVLIVWDGSIGKTATGLHGAIGSTIAALTPVIIPANYLEFFLKTAKPTIERTSRGTGLQHINPDTFWSLPFPLPPLNEQKRIVAKLDQIMPRVEHVKERLEKVPTLLKRFRQSILTAAVTGKLTEKWREKHSELWEKTTLNNLSEYITSGSRGWAKYYSKSGAIFVRAQNIKMDNLILEDVAYVKIPKQTEGLRTKIKKYDLLITITGANVTKTAIVEIDLDEAYVNQHVALVRLKTPQYSNFIYLWLISKVAGRKQLEDSAYGVGKPGLNLQNIKDVEIALPPLHEQKEIVRQVDALFAVADKMEVRYQKAKMCVDKLSQSVLAKAFRGELAAQNPADEPAEKLLERIIAEKGNIEKKKQVQKSRLPKHLT